MSREPLNPAATATSREARSTRRDALVVAAVGVAYFFAHQIAFLYPDAQ
jgi:hypothetical protein